MKKSKFSEEQMVAILREADATNADEAAKNHGISKQTIYAWRQKFRGMDVDDVKRLKSLESENANANVKKMFAEQMLENSILKEVNAKSGKRSGAPQACQLRAAARAVLATLLCAVERSEVNAAL